MKLSISFFFLCSSLLLLLFHGVNGVNLITDTCKKAVASDSQLKFDFCVKSLQANPKSQTADLQGLGVISMELAITNATNMGSYIDTLLKNPKVDPKVKGVLEDCKELYSDAIPDAQDAIDAFKSKDYVTANVKMSADMDASTSCEDGFKDLEVASPLTAKNNDFFQITAIALAIINMFH